MGASRQSSRRRAEAKLALSIREHSRGSLLESGGDRYSGTKGMLQINREECTATPDWIVPAINLMPGWDAKKEEVIDTPEANAMLVRPYRKPWDVELRILHVT